MIFPKGCFAIIFLETVEVEVEVFIDQIQWNDVSNNRIFPLIVTEQFVDNMDVFCGTFNEYFGIEVQLNFPVESSIWNKWCEC